MSGRDGDIVNHCSDSLPLGIQESNSPIRNA